MKRKSAVTGDLCWSDAGRVIQSIHQAGTNNPVS
jgi:hypothetical protein